MAESYIDVNDLNRVSDSHLFSSLDSNIKGQLGDKKCIFCEKPPTNIAGWFVRLLEDGSRGHDSILETGNDSGLEKVIQLYRVFFYCDHDDCAIDMTKLINTQKSIWSIYFFGTKLLVSQYELPIEAGTSVKPVFLSSCDSSIRSEKIEAEPNRSESVLGFAMCYTHKVDFLKLCKMFSINTSKKMCIISWPHCIVCLGDKKDMKYGPYCESCHNAPDE